jgi:DNA-binding beta-propeller fold protein YncE
VATLGIFRRGFARSWTARLAVPAAIGALALAAPSVALAAPAAAGPKVIATIKSAPANSVAVSPVTGAVYVATGAVYDPFAGSVTCDYPRLAAHVLVISGQTSRISRSIRTECISGPLAISRRTGNVYLPTADSDKSTSGSVTVIDHRTDKVIAAVPVTGIAMSVTVSPLNGNVYAASYVWASGAWTLTVISGRNNAIIARLRVGGAAAVSPVTGDVYVPTRSGTGVLVLSGTTSKVLATVPLGLPASDRYGVTAIVVSPVNGKVYAESGGYHEPRIVSVISARTSKVRATLNLNDEESGGDITVSPVTGNVYVAESQTSTVVVISGTTDKIMPAAISPAGIAAYFVAVNPRSGDLYVGSGNAVSEFSGKTSKTSKAIGEVKVPNGVVCITSSPRTGDTYVATDEGISVISG